MRLITEDPQEIVNLIWEHFVVNNGPRSMRIDRPNCCVYRGKDGAKCAAGLLIPDQEYNSSMEGKAIAYLIGVPSKALRLISELQLWHDDRWGIEPRERAIEALKELIRYHDLQVPR